MSSLISRTIKGRGRTPVTVVVEQSRLDWLLLAVFVGVSLFGLVLIASSSIPFAERNYGSAFYFVIRQSIFLLLSLLLGAAVFCVPIRQWEKYGPLMLIGSLFLLSLVWIPGIGKEVNGSRRWIDLGLFNVQVSEAVKLFIIVYLAGYLVRRGELVQNTLGGFVKPMVLICFADALLLLEPDFGAAAVITMTAMIMLFVAGVRVSQFAALIAGLMLVTYFLIWLSPYRLARFLSFLSPFDDPFGRGFQLTQSLIAIGSGSWTGVGLGSSVQKLFYLPEAHTDFVYAILAEEMGLFGSLAVIFSFSFIVWKSFALSRRAYEIGHRFAAFVALGIGTWIGLQSFINIGVNMGVLPTKGITLPMLSYGGSSALIFAISFGILLRIDYEVREQFADSMKPMPRPQEPLSGGRVNAWY